LADRRRSPDGNVSADGKLLRVSGRYDRHLAIDTTSGSVKTIRVGTEPWIDGLAAARPLFARSHRQYALTRNRDTAIHLRRTRQEEREDNDQR
jgi:hypothetical protein